MVWTLFIEQWQGNCRMAAFDFFTSSQPHTAFYFLLLSLMWQHPYWHRPWDDKTYKRKEEGTAVYHSNWNTHIPQIHFDLSTVSAPSGGVDSMDKSTL